MKKTSYILALLMSASALFLSSCAKEKASGAADGDLVECTLQADVIGTGTDLDIDSKVALNADGVTPNWEEGDKILVLDADKKPVGTDGIFTLSSGSGTASGEFKGKVNVGQTPKYAIYPASAATVSGTSAVTAGKLMSGTDDNDGTIKAAVMLGSSSDGKSFSFTNACAVLKFNTGDYGMTDGDPAIKSVKISASYGETAAPVAGAFTIDWENLSIAAADTGTEDELTVELPSTLQINNQDVYIPIFPLAKNSSEVAPSMKYEFTNASGVAKISYDFSDAIAVNTLKNLGVAKDLEFRTPGPDPNYWVDLGMVSDNGYPLYISKRNVKEIIDGVVYFTDSETELGGQFQGEWKDFLYTTFLDLSGTGTTAPKEFVTENGLKCHITSVSEQISLLDNSNFMITNEDGGLTFTSKINNKSIFFPFADGSVYLGTDHGGITFYNTLISRLSKDAILNGIHDGGVSEDMRYPLSKCLYKVVYENTNGNVVSLDDFEVFAFHSYKFNVLTNVLSHLTQITEGSVYNAGILQLYGHEFMLKINCGNGYKLSSTHHIDGYQWTGFVQDVPNIVAPNPYYSQGNNDITVSHGTQTLHFTYYATCLVKGTLVTLADGSRKAVEDLTYDDELKVWNFDKGCFDTAKIFWLTKSGMTADHYIKCTFSDGTVLCLTGDKSHHKVYNYTDRFFEGIANVEVGKEIFTENGVVTLVSKEWIDEPVENYNLMTEGHFNCFANGILTSVRLNNIYPIDENMKFIKDGRKIRSYKEFKTAGISREWYNGLRLSEQTDSLDYIKSKVDIFTEQMLEKPAPTLWQRIKTWWKSVFGR